jgi:hypothetical protein
MAFRSRICLSAGSSTRSGRQSWKTLVDGLRGDRRPAVAERGGGQVDAAFVQGDHGQHRAQVLEAAVPTHGGVAVRCAARRIPHVGSLSAV